MRDDENSRSEQDFEELHKKCLNVLDTVDMNEAHKDKHVDDCKELMRELECIVEEMERDSSMAVVDRKVREARAKGYRNKYNQLVKIIMKADSQLEKGIPFSNGYRLTSDLITEENRKMVKGSEELTKDNFSDEFIDNPEEVQALKRNLNLEKKIVIGAGVIFFIFLIAFLIIHFCC